MATEPATAHLQLPVAEDAGMSLLDIASGPS